MKILVSIVSVLMQTLYTILKCQKVKNRIVFITRQSDKTPEDFELLVHEITSVNPDIECVILARMIPDSSVGKILYMLHMLKQMQYLATSKIVVLDTYCIVVSLLTHRGSLRVVQIWHALGAFKKFGYSALGVKEGSTSRMAKFMKMHQNYDYVVTSSEYCRKYYAEAFNIDIDKVVVYPLPRLDKLDRDTSCNGRKVLYAPTFRKEQPDITNEVKELADILEDSNMELTVKLHPLSTCDDTLKVVDRYKNLSELLCEADIIVTDYSSLIFEASYMNKKIYLYAYDYGKYKKNRDFYLDYEDDIPYDICYSIQQLKDRLVNSDSVVKDINKFTTKYIREAEEGYTKELTAFILGLNEHKV